MKNLSYIILILLSTSTFLASQINTQDTFDTVLDMDKDAPYSWVTNFNERNQSPKQRYKNEKTHKLDSTISVSDNYQPSGPFRTRTKIVYKFEKFRDLAFIYDQNDDLLWNPSSFSAYHYNTEEQLIGQTYNLWDGELDDVTDKAPLILRTYKYNEDNLLMEYQVRGETDLQNNTLGAVRYYEYTDDGLIESETFYDWSVADDSLRLERKQEFSYNDLRQLELYMDFRNDKDRGYYATDSIIYTHHADTGLLDVEIKYVKPNNSDDWSFDKRSTYQHNSEGLIEKVKIESFTSNNVRYKVDTLFYTYHPYGSLRDITTVITDSFTYIGYIRPLALSKSAYDYDGNVEANQVQRIRTDFFRTLNYEANHMLTEISIFDVVDQFLSLTLINNVDLYYSEIKTTATVDVIENTGVYIIAPNPASDYIEIRSSEYSGDVHISLIDISGRQVIDQETNVNSRIDIGHLAKGAYIYTVTDGTNRSTGKVLVH